MIPLVKRKFRHSSHRIPTHNISKEYVDSFFHDLQKKDAKIPQEDKIKESSPKRKREDAKSTPKNEDFLPDFG